MRTAIFHYELLANSRAPSTALRSLGDATAATATRQFLAALPEDDQRWLLDHSQKVDIAARTPLSRAGAAMEYCYFVERGLVSCVLRLADGFESAAGMIGLEGVIGLHALTSSGAPAPHETVVQLPLSAWRISATDFHEAIVRRPEVLRRMLRFDQALRLQVAQLTVCNLRHSLQQRLARWLLMASECTEGDELPLTHELLSSAIGAQRASVTIAAKLLRDAGAIRYQRGHIHLRDRRRLQDMSCECYGVVRERYQRLLDWPHQTDEEST